MYTLNFWPILVASVVSFGIGALWYSPILFGRDWIALQKISDADLVAMRERGVWVQYLLHFIATLITFSILAFAINLLGITNGSDGAFVGFLAWLGFMLPLSLSGLLWKKEPFKLFLIDAVNNLLVLIIGGAIIGAWR